MGLQAIGSEERMQAERSLKKPSQPRAKISATHSLKGRVMESLDHKEPQTTRALSQKLELHQSSVSHTLNELMEEDLVTKKGKGYRLSNVGLIQRNVQDRMAKTLRCLMDHRDFFLSHDLSGIPLGFQVSMGVVSDGQEAVEKDPAIPYHMNNAIISILKQSSRFLVASFTLVPDHQLTVAQAVREGGHLQAVSSDRILQELRLQSHALKDVSLHSRKELYRHNNVNLHLIVTESHLILALPRLDGTCDLENIIISKDREALNWGRMLYYYFQSYGEKVDLATF
jgi:predicted transcriptional regulator